MISPLLFLRRWWISAAELREATRRTWAVIDRIDDERLSITDAFEKASFDEHQRRGVQASFVIVGVAIAVCLLGAMISWLRGAA